MSKHFNMSTNATVRETPARLERERIAREESAQMSAQLSELARRLDRRSGR